MKIGKGLAILISILFFFELMGIVVLVVISLFPWFTFSENPFIRVIFLIGVIFITRLFYNFLQSGSDNDQKALQYGSEDIYKKIAIGTVIGIFIIIVIFIIRYM